MCRIRERDIGNMNLFDFSVVIPLYNREHTIHRAVKSVLEQTYGSWELIVVDDGSTDNGASSVEAINDPRIFLVRQENAGVSAARNTGIAHSTKPFVAFLDADDTWEPEYLEQLNKLINRFPGMGAYATSYFLKYPARGSTKAVINGVPENGEGGQISNYFKGAATGSNPLCTISTCVPREILLEMGGFPEGVSLHEDLYLWAKIALKYPIAFCPVPLATYYKFEEDGTCLNRVIEVNDFLFFNFLGDLIDQRELSMEILAYVKRYLNQWVVRDAVKAAAISNVHMAQACMALCRPESSLDKVKLKFIGLYLQLPVRLQERLRVSGRRLKSFIRSLKSIHFLGSE